MTNASVDALLTAIQQCRRFISTQQVNVMVDAVRGEEGEWFKAKFIALAHLFDVMPRTYDTDGADDKAVVHLHYFTASADWYITERDQEVAQQQAFGLADLFGDGGELGYISILELIRNGAELDLHWRTRALGEVKRERSRRHA